MLGALSFFVRSQNDVSQCPSGLAPGGLATMVNGKEKIAYFYDSEPMLELEDGILLYLLVGPAPLKPVLDPPGPLQANTQATTMELTTP